MDKSKNEAEERLVAELIKEVSVIIEVLVLAVEKRSLSRMLLNEL